MPALTSVTDPLDPRLDAYRDIREGDLVGRKGRFVAEGEVVLRVLVSRSPYRTELVLVAENRLAAVEADLARLPGEVPVYVVGRDAMAAIAGFPIHRGLLAIGRRPDPPSADALLAGLPARALILGLVGLANHDNVGGVFRNAAAFGADAVLIDAATCDPLYRKAIRVSVGAALIVPFARVPEGAALAELLARHGFETLALSPAGREALSAVVPGARTALLLGTEGAGLPPGILAGSRTVAIPMRAGFDSLNVATASGIALHHRRACAMPPHAAGGQRRPGDDPGGADPATSAAGQARLP